MLRTGLMLPRDRHVRRTFSKIDAPMTFGVFSVSSSMRVLRALGAAPGADSRCTSLCSADGLRVWIAIVVVLSLLRHLLLRKGEQQGNRAERSGRALTKSR
jgi:hypothetical protein